MRTVQPDPGACQCLPNVLACYVLMTLSRAALHDTTSEGSLKGGSVRSLCN